MLWTVKLYSFLTTIDLYAKSVIAYFNHLYTYPCQIEITLKVDMISNRYLQMISV